MRRLAETRAWLGVSDEHAGWWTNGLYQAANRLTFLRWWRGVLLESAWLANIYFVDDPSDHRVSTSRLCWLRAIDEDDRRLGIARDVVPGLGTVLIGGKERSQLIAG